MLSVWHHMFSIAVVIGALIALAYRSKHWPAVLVAALVILPLLSRDAFLPFLGRAAYPCDSMPVSYPRGADTEFLVQTLPGTRVVFWAADGTGDYRSAYGDLSNAGVAVADRDGVARLAVRAPQGYSVRWKRLRPHVHYRVCGGHGMIGRVETLFARR